MNRATLLPRIALASLALGAGAAAHAAALGDNTVKLAPSKFKLPQNIGPLRYSGENRYKDRRMGRSFGYNASGISLNIYVYNFGYAQLPDGPDSVAACEQFESAKREIEDGGNYEAVHFEHEVSRRLKSGAEAPLAREAEYTFNRKGIHAVSVLWITAADGFFIKVRLSLRTEIADELEEARAQILDALADAIAARPARLLAGPPAREATIDVEANSDPTEAALWLTYAVELNRFSREQPQTRSACGGVLAPGFAAELSARRAALDEYLAREPARRSSRYFDELARIDAAGFFDEYVWHYLRNEKWDLTAPMGTKLAEFEDFRARELASHRMQSGAHVRLNEVRVLPLAP
jgi:hypothetical protein